MVAKPKTYREYRQYFCTHCGSRVTLTSKFYPERVAAPYVGKSGKPIRLGSYNSSSEEKWALCPACRCYVPVEALSERQIRERYLAMDGVIILPKRRK